MKFAILGAGGIGGYYGGRLAHAGEDVTFIARGPHLEALRSRGLSVRSAFGDFHLPRVQAADDPASVGVVDTVIVATKAYDLERAADALRPLVGPETAVVPLLNGVDIAQRLGAVVGMEHLLGGFCHISCAIAEPGVIEQRGDFQRLVIGELDGSHTPRAEAIHAAFERAGASAELSGEIVREVWEKFLYIASAAGMCALTGATLGPVRQDPETRRMFVACMAEIEAVGRAEGVDLPEGIVQRTLQRADASPPDVRPSMLFDLQRGRRLEVEALNGTAARLGEAHGVPVPVNRFIFAALKLRAAGSA